MEHGIPLEDSFVEEFLKVGQADLFIVGSGITGPEQLTLESLVALASSEVVFGFPDVGWIAPVVNRVGSQFVELAYPSITPRAEIFRQAAHTITTAALKSPPVSLLCSGSPVRHVGLTNLLRQWADREEVPCRVILGLSSLDALLSLLRVDDSEGVQLFDATTLLVRREYPSSKSHCFIFNVDKIGTERSTAFTYPREAMLMPLRDHLLHGYPPDHHVTFVTVGNSRFSHEEVRVPLRCLEQAVEHRQLGTLWLPPVREDTILHEPSHDTMTSMAELVRLAHTPFDQKLGEASERLGKKVREAKKHPSV